MELGLQIRPCEGANFSEKDMPAGMPEDKLSGELCQNGWTDAVWFLGLGAWAEWSGGDAAPITLTLFITMSS